MLFSFVGLILHLLTTPRLNNRNYGFGTPLGYLQHNTLGLVIFVGVTYGQEMFALFRKEKGEGQKGKRGRAKESHLFIL